MGPLGPFFVEPAGPACEHPSMPRLALLLLIAGLAGCRGRATTSTAEPASTTTTTAAAARSAEDQAEDQHERELLAKAADQFRDKYIQGDREVRLLPDADRAAVEDLRKLLTVRPPVEMTDDQRRLYDRHPEYFRSEERLAYTFAVADQAGARELCRRLKLSPDDRITLKAKLAHLPKEIRDTTVGAVRKALDSGVRSLTDTERNYLRASNLSPYLDNAKD
jgi:hypothetical protein